MVGSDNGPILTETKRDVIEGRYEGKRQAKYDHKKTIQTKSKDALYDLAYLFRNHNTEEFDLDLEKVLGEGFDSDDGPIPRQRHNQRGGFIPDRYVDDDGNPRDPDPSINPNVKHELRKRLEQLSAPNKSSPETQEALIDAVAFICRAAEAGELKIVDLLERGYERYQENRSERKPNESEKIVKVTEREYGGVLNTAKQKEREGRMDELSPMEMKALREYE